MPPKTLRFKWTEDNKKDAAALNRCPKWLKLWEHLITIIPNLNINFPMLGLVGITKASKKTMSPITFWNEYGGAHYILEEDLKTDAEDLKTYITLLIHYQWSFKAPHPWNHIRNPIREYGQYQHLCITEWKTLVGYDFEVRIPEERLLQIENTLKYGQAIIDKTMRDFAKEDRKTGKLKAKLTHNSGREHGPKAYRLVSCMFCGQCVLPDPVKCVNSKAFRMAHFKCVIDFQKQLESFLLMTTRSFPCVAKRCPGTIYFTAVDKSLPTWKDWLKIMFHAKYCEKCKFVIWRKDEDRHLKSDCEKFLAEDSPGDVKTNTVSIINKIDIYDEECIYEESIPSELQTGTSVNPNPNLLRSRKESFSEDEQEDDNASVASSNSEVDVDFNDVDDDGNQIDASAPQAFDSTDSESHLIINESAEVEVFNSEANTNIEADFQSLDLNTNANITNTDPQQNVPDISQPRIPSTNTPSQDTNDSNNDRDPNTRVRRNLMREKSCNTSPQKNNVYGIEFPLDDDFLELHGKQSVFRTTIRTGGEPEQSTG